MFVVVVFVCWVGCSAIMPVVVLLGVRSICLLFSWRVGPFRSRWCVSFLPPTWGWRWSFLSALRSPSPACPWPIGGFVVLVVNLGCGWLALAVAVWWSVRGGWVRLVVVGVAAVVPVMLQSVPAGAVVLGGIVRCCVLVVVWCVVFDLLGLCLVAAESIVGLSSTSVLLSVAGSIGRPGWSLTVVCCWPFLVGWPAAARFECDIILWCFLIPSFKIFVVRDCVWAGPATSWVAELFAHVLTRLLLRVWIRTMSFTPAFPILQL